MGMSILLSGCGTGLFTESTSTPTMTFTPLRPDRACYCYLNLYRHPNTLRDGFAHSDSHLDSSGTRKCGSADPALSLDRSLAR